jgi:two-component system sensor histidine kinase YesM
LDLAKFYRLSLNEGRTIIPVSDELEQAKAYIGIQKTKYEERMNVHYDIDPGILQYDTMKLILQPFIENVLEHAWCADRIHIRIVGLLEEDNIVFKIIDDGIGIHPNLIHQMFDPVGGLNVGYGIRNVDQRIKLHYGNEYGVLIFSRRGIGTTVRISIPVQRTRAGQM